MELYVANSESPFIACMLEFFNMVLGNSGIQSEKFWATEIKTLLLQKYKSGLTREEAKDNSYYLMRSIKMYDLISRMSFLCGIELSDTFTNSLRQDSSVVLHTLDFMQVSIKVIT
jgi:hypothetical protein